MAASAAWGMLQQTFHEWSEDEAPQLGASLAFYSVLSLAPLLVIVLAIAGAVFGGDAARSELVGQIQSMVGKEGAAAIDEVIAHAQKPKAGMIASALGVVTLLFGASGVFGQLQSALNRIFDVKPRPGRGILGMVRDRFLSFTMVFGTGFLLLVSLALSAFLAAAGKWASSLLPAFELLWNAVNLFASFVVISLLFALIFKYVPDIRLTWRQVGIGAVLTAFLFTVGKFALGLYLGRQAVGSAYGAAGSLVVLLVWVYYSSQILFLGAEFTQVYSKSHGPKPTPEPNAVWEDGARNDSAALENAVSPSGERHLETV